MYILQCVTCANQHFLLWKKARRRKGHSSQEGCSSYQLLHHQQWPLPTPPKDMTFPLLQNCINSIYGINWKVECFILVIDGRFT